MEPPFFWEFSWVTSRLTEAPLVLSWGVTPLALVWIPVTLLCGGVLWRSRGGGLRLAEVVALGAVAGASLAGDFVGLWLCTVVFLGLAPVLGRTQERGEPPPADVTWMQTTGWIACGVWMFAFLWMWREFATFRPADLAQAVLTAPEDVTRQAALRLIVMWLGGGGLLLGGVFPTGGWIGGVSRSPGAGWVFGPGRFALASVWMLRTTPLLEVAWPGRPFFAGPAALTAVLMAFLALTADDRRSVVGFAACTLTAVVLAAAGSGHATGAAAGLLLTLTSMLVVTALTAQETAERVAAVSSAPPGEAARHAGLTPAPQPSTAPSSPLEKCSSSWVGWWTVVIVASGVWGQQQGVSAVMAGWSRSFNSEDAASAAAVPESTPESETGRLATVAVGVSFAAAQLLLACALTRLICLERRGGRSGVKRGGLTLLLLVTTSALPGAIQLTSEAEIVSELAGPAEFGELTSPAYAPGLLGVLGLLGGVAGFVLYRQPSPWPERLADWFESLDRLGRQEFYLETLSRRVTTAARSVARVWQVMDSPDRTARQHSPLAAALRWVGTRLEPLWSRGGWQPAVLVVATALVLWGALVRSERRPLISDDPVSQSFPLGGDVGRRPGEGACGREIRTPHSDPLPCPKREGGPETDSRLSAGRHVEHSIDRNSPAWNSEPVRDATAAMASSGSLILAASFGGDVRSEPRLLLPSAHP